MRRVVVTGLGILSPLGGTAESSWKQVLAGRSGIRQINRFDVSDLPVRIAGLVPTETDTEQDDRVPFRVDQILSAKEQRKVDVFIVYALAAAEHAIHDAGIRVTCDEEAERIGVLIGSGIGGLPWICETSQNLSQYGPRRVSPFFIPASLINLASGHVAIRHGFKGPCHSVVTACATGTHAIGDAARLIQLGDAEVMIAGGAEAAVSRIGMSGFAACKALASSFNDNPEAASRPWDTRREGFVMGEGAGILVLESLEYAEKRGAHIYAEWVGYGMSGDAHHITAPPEDGAGAMRAMRRALQVAEIRADDIDYINAHGTSTPLGDLAEIRAVKTLFRDHAYCLAMSSTKSAIGHLLGAAGSVEAVFSILALRDQVVPPTLNLDEPSEECDLNLVPHHPQERKLRYVMSNSFGFGGTNASIIFKQFP
jgi:3-oxoacyl-[acyl-carrier-protein] synthase II